MSSESEENVKSKSWKDNYKFSVGAVILIFFQWISGMGAYCSILTMPIYMASILQYSETTSTIIYHAKSSLTYVLYIFGAIIADSFLGRMKTFLYFQPVNILIMISISILSIYSIANGIIVCYFLLALIGGLISPAVRALIPDQIPESNKEMLSTYMHIIYFINNFGVILVAYTAPIMHKDIYCFGIECYPLVFFVSTALISIASVLFLVGFCCKQFVVHKPTENLLLNIIRCVSFSVQERVKFGKPEENRTWLDLAKKKFDSDFVNDLKIAKSLCIFLLAHPLFWTVFEQLSSIWTLQAQYMNGMITNTFTIKADQMQTLNPILVVILIPVFEVIIYPFLSRINFKVPYRIMMGQYFTALACISMLVIQLKIDRIIHNNPNIIQLNAVNLGNGNVTIQFPMSETVLQRNKFISMSIDGSNGNMITTYGMGHKNQSLSMFTGKCVTILLKENSTILKEVDRQTNGGYANIRTISAVGGDMDYVLRLVGQFGVNNEFVLSMVNDSFGSYVKCGIGRFNVVAQLKNGKESKQLGSVTLLPAQTKDIIIFGNSFADLSFMELDESLYDLPSIGWQVIPYVLVTIGEVLFNVNTGVFLYGESPKTMKSMMLAGQYVCIAIGNLLILIFKRILVHMSTVYLFLLCGILVALSGIATGILAYFYLKSKHKNEQTENSLTETKISQL